MKKQEYIDILKEKLKIFDDKLANEILEDYESHFCDGLRKGKSEEDICTALGNIDEIVIELKQLYDTLPIKPQEDKVIIELTAKDIHNDIDFPKMNIPEINIDLPNINTPSIAIPNTERDTHSKAVYENETNNNMEKANLPCTKLKLDADCANVNIHLSENNKFSLRYNNNGSMKQQMMYRFFSEQKGDTFYAYVVRENSIGKFFSFFTNPYIVIDAYIPKGFELVEIKGINGAIEICDVESTDIKIKSASGNVKMSNLYCKNTDISTISGYINSDIIKGSQFSLDSKSGDLSVQNCLSNRLIARTLSGKVNFNNIKGIDVLAESASGCIEVADITADDIKISSKSGDNSLLNGIVKTAFISSISGDVKVENITAEKIKAHSVSGDVDLYAKSNKVNSKTTSGDICLQNKGNLTGEFSSVSGDINIDLDNNSEGYTVKTETLSGDVNLNLNREHIHIKQKNGLHTLGLGISRLAVKTMSGDIRIQG